MASFFDDFKEKKKKKKSLVQTVTPAKAVKAKQETQAKTVSQNAKATVNKNKNFAKAYENKKKVSLPTVTKPSLPKQTMNGSLRTPIRAMGETKKRAAQNTAVETRRRNQQTLSAADKKLSPVKQRAVQTYKADWANAKARGDRAAMNLAHQRAEDIRRQQGYSGGVAGNEYISPKISRQDRNLLNDSGQMAMKQAKLDFDRASDAGNTLAMKEAILEMTALRKGEKYRSMDMRPTMGTDAYGRPIYGKTQREQLMGEAMGKGVAGGLLSLRETANTALRNQARQRWTADKTPEMVNPNALGQRLMRESTMAGAMATQDLSGGKKLLAETAISMGQMLPGMAASAIPVVGPAIGAAMLSGQAAGAKAFELNERGVDPGEALTRGLISGGIEGLTEAIPLARLGNILTGSAGRSLVKNVLGQMGIEGTEESISYTLNYLADKAAKDPEAVWSWDELKRNALAGAIAGGALAGAGSLAMPSVGNETNVRKTVENVESGLVRDDYTSRQDQKAMDEIDAASKLMGVQVGFQARTPGGMPRTQGNQIILEQGTQAPARFMFGRQLAGWMEQAAPEAYGQFKNIIAQEEGVQNQVRAVMAEAKDLGMAYTEEQALDQVAADYAGAMMENNGILQKFAENAKQDKGMLQKMSEGLRSLGQKLTGKQAQKAKNAAEALELAMHETIKGSRLLTGKEQRIKNRQMAQAQRWDLDRRDAITERITEMYQDNHLPAAVRARVDQVGIEGMVDEYLNGNLPNHLRSFGRSIEAYEEANRNYSFLRPEEYSNDIAEAAEVARQLGLNLEMVDQVAGGRANAEIEGNTVRIEKWNPNPVRFLFGHEMTHYLQEKATDAYNQFRDHVMQTVGPDAVRNKIQEYADHGVELTTEEAIDEIVADYAGQLVENRDLLNKFIQDNRQNKTLLERVLEAIRNLAAKLTGKKKTQAEEAAALLEKAMQEVRGQVKQGTKEKKTKKQMQTVGNEMLQAVAEGVKPGKSDLGTRENVRYSLVKDRDTLRFLENQKHVKVYRAMQEIDGKLYPPMAAKIKGENGKKQLVEPTKVGEWYQADERPDLIKLDKNGKPKFELNKGNGGMVPAAYNPYFHTSATPLNDQFSSAYDRPNLVVVEGFIPESELTSGYKAQYAKDSVGETTWHAGPVAAKLKGEKSRRVFLSRWFKVDRVVPVNEVAKIIADTLKGENLQVPWNVVTPSLREALEEQGVEIDYKDIKAGSKMVSFESTQKKYSLKTTRRDTSGSDYERAYEMVYGKQGKPKTVEQAANQEAVGVIDRLQNLETPKPKTKAKPLPKPGERKVEAVQEDPIPAEDLAYMDELVDAAISPRLEAEFKTARDMIPGGKVEKTPLTEKGKDIGGFAYRKFVDSGDEIRKAGKQAGDKYLYFYYNQAKASTATAQNMIAMRQTDVNGKKVGESLVDIFGPIKKKGQEYFKDFQDYLLHRHNINRMGTKEERQMQRQATQYLWDFEDENPEYKGWTLPEIRDAADDGDQIAKEYLEIKKEKAFWDSKVKPVFNYEMTPEKSQARVRQYEGRHPEFKDLAKRVYAYNQNLMQYRVDSGLISKDTAEYLQKRYPDYVPTFHQQDGVSTAERGKGTKVGKTVKKATGNTGNNPFVDMDKAMAQQTMSVVRESAKNRFGQRLLNEDISQDYIINVESLAQQKALAELHDEDGFKSEQTNKDNTFTVYKGGKAYEITMTPAMYEGIKSLSKTGESDKLAIKTVIGANNVYKKLITAWNPLFTVKNFLKDLQDALLYTGDAKAFAKNYPKAFKQIFGNGDEWKLYQALGGTASSVYETEKGVQLPTDNVAAKMVGKVAFLNQAIEQAPRLAEFMATADKGSRTQEELMEAMYKAADITTNFGRSGDVTKMLNSSFVPFLNPSIQGVDKLMRTVRDNPRAVGPWVGLIGKAAILGVAPAIINAALFGGEDDYDELNQRDKDNNFMMPLRLFNEEWAGMWFRFPRGRALAAMGAITNAGMNKVQGKDVDMIDLVTTVWGNIGVVNPMTSNIARPLVQTAILDPDNPGKTWYGGDIETQAMQNKKPGERYNEKTDIVSKFVGGKLGVSPAKINYLLDSYTGVVGDLALPLLTPTNPVGKNPLSKAFVTDSTTSNRLSGDFYDLGDQLKYDEQDGDTSATIAYNYWSKVSKDLSDVNEEIRKMENDLSLDNKDKRKKYRDLKAKANEIIREGMANVDAFRKAAEEYNGEINEDTEWDVLVELTRDVLGAEKALEYDGKTTYEKAQEIVKEGGSYESYYDYLQVERTLNDIMDAESNLNTLNERNITGAKLTEAQNKVDLLNKEHQELVEKSMEGSNGWKPTSTDRKLSALESLELPEEEAFAIWKMKILDSEQRYKMEVLEEAGLPQMDYFRYKMAVKHLNGYEDSSEPGTTKRNSKKDMRVPIINSLDLTPAQKDILYLDVENWAKSGLYKTPWH